MNTQQFEEIAKKAGFDRNKISVDLTEYYNIVKKHTHWTQHVVSEWGSVENFVDFLYWMKFESHLNLTQMIILTGKKSLYRSYDQLGWGYNTFDFDECYRLREQYLKELEEIKCSFNESDGLFNEEKFYTITKDSRGNISRKACSYYGVKSEEELIRKLYYYYYIKELRTQDLAVIFNLSIRGIEKLLNKLNMSLSFEETQKRAAQNRDYRNIYAKMRHTMASSLEYDGMFGSRIENTIRTNLATELESELPDTFEVIVGLNTRSIIPPYEVDIPIIITDKEKGSIYRFAVEIDGESFHSDDECIESDEKKNKHLTDAGWIILRIPIMNKQKGDQTVRNEVLKCLDSIFEIVGHPISNRINITPRKEKNEENFKTVDNEKLCSLCKSKMVKRIAKFGKFKGNEFWGCSNYPNCTYLENLQKESNE